MSVQGGVQVRVVFTTWQRSDERSQLRGSGFDDEVDVLRGSREP
jgi:hypothetical protein